MPVDAHVVGRIEEGRIDMLLPTTRPGMPIATVAAADPVIANPDIARPGPGGLGNRNDLVIGSPPPSGLCRSRRSRTRHRQIEIDIDKLRQFHLENFQIPAGIERDLVVGQP